MTFESYIKTAGLEIADLLKYDIVVVYEGLAIAQIENAQGRWGNLRIDYPDITRSSDHPAAILSGDWVSDA
jgi:hypothetical protein